MAEKRMLLSTFYGMMSASVCVKRQRRPERMLCVVLSLQSRGVAFCPVIRAARTLSQLKADADRKCAVLLTEGRKGNTLSLPRFSVFVAKTMIAPWAGYRRREVPLLATFLYVFSRVLLLSSSLAPFSRPLQSRLSFSRL